MNPFRVAIHLLLRKVFHMSQQLDDLIKTEADAEARILNAVGLIAGAAQLKTDLDVANAALAQAKTDAATAAQAAADAAAADATKIADLNTRLAAAIAALPPAPTAALTA